MATLIDAPAGLEGVVAAETAVGDVRGDEGFYHYRGHPAADLAATLPFEAVWHLMHAGRLPDAAALTAFTTDTTARRAVSDDVFAALPAIAATGTPMAALRTALSLAGQDDRPWLDTSPDERRARALAIVAQAPVLAAALWRLRSGQSPVPSDPALGLAANYLWMVTGVRPAPEAVSAVERYLVLTIDHGFNASTFTARVVASTGADLTAAAIAGLAALSGPLHGGAPSRVLDMLREIGTAERARPWLEERLAAGQRIMGFGHRIYRTDDPRSVVLKATARAMGGPLVVLAEQVEALVLDILETKYPERRLRTNVEFYAGVVLEQAGLPPALFPVTFGLSRLVGWMAHVIEQSDRNRLIRPASRYVGPPAPRP
ncbi:MAG: citrate synthase [Vicinamibacterales bacterium]